MGGKGRTKKDRECARELKCYQTMRYQIHDQALAIGTCRVQSNKLCNTCIRMLIMAVINIAQKFRRLHAVTVFFLHSSFLIRQNVVML